MALGALSKGTDVKVVPVGLNYFHPHKFRSRAVIELGDPISVPSHLVDNYDQGRKHEAVGEFLGIIQQSLVSVTQSSPDYETLLNVHAARRLYFSTRQHKVSLPAIIEVNRRLLKLYIQHASNPAVIAFNSDLRSYRAQLRALGIREHQMQYATLSTTDVLLTLTYRLGLLALLAAGTLPGLLLFSPIFTAAKLISHQKTKEALAASSVKLRGRDVMATWKLLVVGIFTPLLYIFYTLLFTFWIRSQASEAPVSLHLTTPRTITLGLILFPAISCAASEWARLAWTSSNRSCH